MGVVQWKVGLVEDDPVLARAVSAALRGEGYRVRSVRGADEGIDLIAQWNPDLVLLDLSRPAAGASELLARFREVSDAALVAISAGARVTDIVAGLRAGADDFLGKPFAMEELVARVQAVLRRTRSRGAERMELGDLVIDIAAGMASRGERRLPLTATEFRILAVLARQSGKILTQDQISDQLWPVGSGPESNSIEVHIARLRRKLEAAGEVRILHTARGMGYVLKLEEG
jgi:DNA-binding response OmpR family regulator